MVRTLLFPVSFLAGCDLAALDDLDKAPSDCPTAEIDHTALEWVDTEVGSRAEATLDLSNDCDGDGDLVVEATLSGAAFSLAETAWTIAQGESATITLAYEPTDATADAGSLLLTTNDPDRPEIAVTLSGIPMADDDGDGSPASEDCDDNDADVYPGAPEVPYDDIDSDCDGRSDFDQDLDGFDSSGFGGEDCNDTDATVFPGAADTPYDGVDADCAGDSDFDADGDGEDSIAYGGLDCDDSDPNTYPGAVDAPYDGVDADCVGDDDFDADGDGYTSSLFGGQDCDDRDRAVFPEAVDVWYDGVDTDCDGWSDYDQDRDGHDTLDAGGGDCDDEDAGKNPDAADPWYDGEDTDCAGNDDFDQDADGEVAALFGGSDCNDVDATVYLGAVDVWYDGIDSDCAGDDDYDQDSDGDPSSLFTGTDCDDLDASVYAGATDLWYDGVDADCEGDSDYDQDADGQDSDVYSGLDCDDTDENTYDGAAEIWYDGIDGDCAGDGDYDQDGDGMDRFPEGEDCDDTDATSTAGTAELENGLDDDCDGLVDEDFVDAGDVIITEVMLNSDAVSDTAGEWFEVYNTTATTVDMKGWIVYSDDGGNITISSSVLIEPGGYAVLGVESDTALNGGVTLDYEYVRSSFSFADTEDTVFIVSGSTTVVEFAYGSGWPVYSAGFSMALDKDHYTGGDDAVATYWCASKEELSGGDHGTPGEAHGNCYLDDDGDGAQYSDCDDDDPDRNYLETETGNGIDDDCNGFIDESVYNIATLDYVEGGTYGGYLNFSGVADFDGDGSLELAGYHEGTDTAYFLPTAGYSSWAGVVSAYDDLLFTTASTAQTYTGTPNDQQDVNDDGFVDLAYTNSVSGTTGFVVFKGPFTATATARAADYRFSVSEAAYSSANRLSEGHDFDGDGAAELVYANAYSITGGASGGGAVAIFEAASMVAAMDYDEATVTLTGGSMAYLGYGSAFGDVNDDGYDDVVAYSYTGSSINYVWLGDGFATTGKQAISSVATATLTGSGTASTLQQLEDADGDGTLDLVTGVSDRAHWYFDIGGFSGTTADPVPDAVYNPEDYGNTYSYWSSVGPLAIPHDVDGDGDDEIAITGSSFFSDTTYSWFGAGAFADGVVTGSEAELSLTFDGGYSRAQWADLDASGDDELMIGNYSATGSYSYAGGIWVLEP